MRTYIYIYIKIDKRMSNRIYFFCIDKTKPVDYKLED